MQSHDELNPWTQIFKVWLRPRAACQTHQEQTNRCQSQNLICIDLSVSLKFTQFNKKKQQIRKEKLSVVITASLSVFAMVTKQCKLIRTHSQPIYLCHTDCTPRQGQSYKNNAKPSSKGTSVFSIIHSSTTFLQWTEMIAIHTLNSLVLWFWMF